MNAMWEFFENIDELVYVIDMERYELIYMNKKALRAFGLHSQEDFAGKRCHEILRNCAVPCTNCINQELKPGYFKEWRCYDPILGKYLMLKATVLEEKGKRYRMEMALDVSSQEQKESMAQKYRNLETIINEGLRVALMEKTPSQSLAVLLEYLGKALNGERTYIFEKNEKGGDDNTYEWVAVGVQPEKDNLQDVPPEVCANWYQNFSVGRHIVIEDLEDIRETDPLQYENLKRQNIRSLVVVPLYDDGEAIGFFGVDNPPIKSLDYTSNMLQITAHFIISSLRRRNLIKELQEKNYDIFYSLNVDYIGIYHVDFDTDQCETYRKMDGLGDGSAGIRFEDGYQAAMEQYISDYVAEQDKEFFRAMTEKDYVLAQLRTKKKFYVRYHARENFQKVKNLEIHFAGTGKESQENIVIFAFRNVDAVVKQEEKYKMETQREIADILAGSKTGIWTIEFEEGCEPRMYGDRTMQMLLGVGEDIGPEECYQKWFRNIDAEYIGIVQDAVEEMLSSGHCEVAYPWNHPTFGKIYVRCGGLSDKKFNKRGICLKGYHQDITEIKVKEQKQEKEIMEALEKAKQANLAKSEFLSHMSHDIRTPINGILGMLAIIEKNQDNMEKQKECRAKIRVSAEHLLSLVNDVLEISKLESRDSSLVEEPFEVHGLLENCMVILSPKAELAGVKLELDETGLQHRRLIGSPLHLRQILINVIGNAIKYNRENGSAFIRVKEFPLEEGSVECQFIIEDTGIGIGEEFKSHIFEPFTQEHQDARTNYNGTGLGMSITKKLVDQMGGTIEFESRIGEGSVFKITLPLRVDEERDTQADDPGEEIPADISGMKVLLVEDNAINCEIVQYMLEDAGAVAVAVGDGKAAVDTFAASDYGAFDCILMDLMMPEMNGLDATRMIRKMDRPDAETVPIIALSANAFDEDVRMAKEAGMNEHLAKPVDIDKMIRVMWQLKNK